MLTKIYVVENERRAIQTNRRQKRNRRKPLSGHSIPTNNRRNPSLIDRRNAKPIDRRNEERKSVPKNSIDFLFDFLQWRGEFLTEHIRDKEKKKLAIIVSSFAVFSLVTTVALGILSSDSIKPETLKMPAFTILLGVFLIGIAFINTAIIKHIVSLKSDGLLFLRQLNCLRQALHVVMFAKLDGYLPVDLVQKVIDHQSAPHQKPEKKSRRFSLKNIRRRLYYLFVTSKKCKTRFHRFESYLKSKRYQCNELKQSLFDIDTYYWRLYGCHEKLPLDNESLRNSYATPQIFLRSADMFSIVIIALFTVLLTLAPTLYLLPTFDTPNATTKLFAWGGAIVSAIFVLLVLTFVLQALKKVREGLHGDYPGITHIRNTLKSCLPTGTADISH